MVQKWLPTLIGILASVLLISCQVDRDGADTGTDTTIDNQQQSDGFGATDDTGNVPDVTFENQETRETNETVIEDERSPASVNDMEDNMDVPEGTGTGEGMDEGGTQQGTGTDQ